MVFPLVYLILLTPSERDNIYWSPLPLHSNDWESSNNFAKISKYKESETPTPPSAFTENNKVISGEGKAGYAAFVEFCDDGYYLDENGGCRKGISKKTKTLVSSRKKRSSFDHLNWKKNFRSALTEPHRVPPYRQTNSIDKSPSKNQKTISSSSSRKRMKGAPESPLTSPRPSESPSTTTTQRPYLYLISTYCEKGYSMDENGVCQKNIKKKIKQVEERKKRESEKVFPFKKGTENDTKNLESSTKRESQKGTRFPPTLEKIRNDDKNAASDGFGYISKECNKLVPGLVSDGAGGCTKAVKVKHKILQLERRRKRETKKAFVNFISPSNLVANNFTIHLTINGFTKKLNFTLNEEDISDDKAIAGNGFGVNSSRCNELVPGFVSDGAGGCTKPISPLRKRNNRFTFVVKSGKNSEPIINLDYGSPDGRSEMPDPGDENDPEADIL